MADGQAERQARQEAFQPQVGPAALLSADAELYVESAAALRQAARRDPAYNGAAAAARLRDG